MPPKDQTSPNPEQMISPEGSNPPSSLDIVELTSSLQATEPRRAISLHKRSASDSLVILRKPYLVGQSSSSLVTETQKWGRSFEPTMDPKKMKRLLANRVSAQKSRLRRMEYIEKLNKDIETEQAKIAELAPQVSYYKHRRAMLQKENDEIKQKIEFLEKEEARKEAEYQALKDERDMLALTYFLQQEGL
ncbi:hypothetical protein QUC31_011515 [Theobroma cacao]|uniref:Basic leucine zipper 19 n=1 Tax=Theobroma cacao TaxID=3641 RepID=A0AB32WEE1_THECC|nr:PREDICTED: basic leucine zipper 19 [Theobroma cacao]WRX24640.1 Basic-leucine zipper domain - like 10 [Theobroma cacao]